MWLESLGWYLIFEGVNGLTGFRLQPLPPASAEFEQFMKLWTQAGLLSFSVKMAELMAGFLLLWPPGVWLGLLIWGCLLWGICQLQWFLNYNKVLPAWLLLWFFLALLESLLKLNIYDGLARCFVIW